MSSVIVPVHPQTPEERSIAVVLKRLREGAVILYPTDTGMALGCTLRNKDGIDRIRQIRSMPTGQSMTFLCDSLSHIADFARVSNSAFKIIKRLIPGPFTFILPATKLVPTFACDPKRKTVGIRVPQAPFANRLLRELDEPLISISAKDEDGEDFISPEDAADLIGAQVDVVVLFEKFSWLEDERFEERSTIIDMTTETFRILRAGARSKDAEAYIESEG